MLWGGWAKKCKMKFIRRYLSKTLTKIRQMYAVSCKISPHLCQKLYKIFDLSQTLLTFCSCELMWHSDEFKALSVSADMSWMGKNYIFIIEPSGKVHISVSTCLVTVCYPIYIEDASTTVADPYGRGSGGDHPPSCWMKADRPLAIAIAPKPVGTDVPLTKTSGSAPAALSTEPATGWRTVTHCKNTMVYLWCADVTFCWVSEPVASNSLYKTTQLHCLGCPSRDVVALAMTQSSSSSMRSLLNGTNSHSDSLTSLSGNGVDG